ncbi:MAG: hypothetical protein RBT74_08480 [Tenuifilaceae bacterium]|jgi:hypothetical protein|nr:hypothetical protein [Tenuifilaceae bacterium]
MYQKPSKEDLLRIVTQLGREINPEFYLDDVDVEIYFRVFLYFIQDPQFERIDGSYKLSKGLRVEGSVGVGKTMLFQVFKRILKEYLRTESFAFFSPIEVSGKFSTDGFDVISSHSTNCFHLVNGQIDKTKPKTRLYDDLGCESQTTSHFGDKENVMEKILLLRYDMYKSFGMKTHITTNLNSKEIEMRYGCRVRSRLKEMTNAIYYPGEDRRK